MHTEYLTRLPKDLTCRDQLFHLITRRAGKLSILVITKYDLYRQL